MTIPLTKNEAGKIVDEILEKRLFKGDEVSQFIKSTCKVNSNGDLIKILRSIVAKDTFFNFFFDEKFVEVANKTNDYAELIIETAQNQRMSMVLPKLIGLYSIKPDVVEFLLAKFKVQNDNAVGLAVGFILGGIGEKDPSRVYSIIDSNKKPTEPENLSYALALKIISDKHKLPIRFVDKMISFSVSENTQICNIAIQAMAWNLYSISKVQRKLVTLSRNDKTAFMVCNSMIGITKKDKKTAMRLFYACSRTENVQIRRALDTGLGVLAPEFPLECLKIAKTWTDDKDTHFVYNHWFISEIGKADIRKIKDFLLRWLRTEKNYKTRRFELPQIVSQIYSDKEKQLLQLIKSLDYKKKPGADIIVKILETLLSDGYGEMHRSDEFIEQCNKILVKIARLRKIETNPNPTLRSPFMRALAIINAIEANMIISDPKIVKKNLQYFPKIVSFLGKRNIDQMIKKKTHQLVRTLQRLEPEKVLMDKLTKRFENEKDPLRKAFLHRAIATKFYPHAYLSEIESALSLFSTAEQGISSIKSGLLDQELFYDTLPELSLAARFRKKGYAVLLQPIVDQHKLDMKVTLSKDLLVEVYSPHEDIRLKYVRKAHGMANTTKDAILRKLRGQITDAAKQKLPIVLVIDKSNSGGDVTEMEIADILFGTFTWNLVFDNQKHEVVKEYASRKQDSISDIHPAGKAVSAIILVRRDMDDSDLKMKLYGKIYSNPYASIPLDEQTIKALEEAIFGIALT